MEFHILSSDHDSSRIQHKCLPSRLAHHHSPENPEVTINLSEVYGKNVNSLTRRFVKESDHSILIEDKVKTNETTKLLTWGLMTTAEVNSIKNGAILKKNEKELKLTILSPGDLQVSIISLDPPPLEIDKTIENLKRLEIGIPAYLFKNNDGIIQIRLSGGD